ncbi:MAG TPA: hypothetical protein VIV10_07225, partial [Gemmatimonadales bacterium]
GTGYRLATTSGSLLPDTSQAFSITAGTATTLVFSVQPTATVVGGTITPAVVVTALDAGGNTATGFVGNVTMSFGTNAGPGTLSGTLTIAAVLGNATFADLSINTAGTGYTLKAASGAMNVTSLPFNITP